MSDKVKATRGKPGGRIAILILYTLIVLQVAYLTYFQGYPYPGGLLWDENYHIASAQKYLDGVYFMEPHPPLGKMLIALGEYILNPNPELDKSYFTETDYIKEVPPGYSFKGVRLASSLFAMLAAVVFFYIALFSSKNPHVSFAFTSLYLFDNALIVHCRGAMLEGIQLFWIMLSILYFTYSIQKPAVRILDYLILGVFMGFSISVKLNGAILLLMFIFLFLHDQKDNIAWSRIKHLLKQLAIKVPISLFGIFSIFLIVWYMHFSIGKTVVNNQYYTASKEYKEILASGETSHIENYYIMLRDNLKYIREYPKGVPKLDITKPGENGSHPMTWPWGNKAINYRWEHDKDGKGVKYLYLQCNPLTWATGLLALLLSVSLITGRYVFGLAVKNQFLFNNILYFLLLYMAYMVTMLQFERVMYLYHYFIPLIFTFVLSCLMFNYIYEEKLYRHNKYVYIALAVMVIAVIAVYYFYSPLTYYNPLTYDEFQKRVWFNFWQLKSVI